MHLPHRNHIRLSFAYLTGCALAAAIPGCDCSPKIVSVGSTTINIVAPTNMSAYGPGQTFDYKAIATDSIGIASVALYAGPASPVTAGTECASNANCASGKVCSEAHTCMASLQKTCTAPTKGDPSLTCDTQFAVNSNLSLIQHNQILLTAMTVDSRQRVAQTTITVDIKALTISFTAPTISPGTNPPVADVAGTTPVGVSVVSAIPLASVVIVDEAMTSVANWQSPTTDMLQQPVDWNTLLGAGKHTLTATATDTNGDIATATLNIMVEVPSIIFTAPMITTGTAPPVADVTGSSPVAVSVSSFLPLTSVAITYDAMKPLASWATAPVTGPTFTQTIAWATVMGTGPHTLTAIATDNAGETATATLNIVVAGLSIVFTAPTGTGTPPVANVYAASPVAVTVSPAIPLTSVVITYPTAMTLASWTTIANGTTTFSQSENWSTTPGIGTFVLTATATATDGETATANLTVQITKPGCTSDTDCSNGQRCCATDGTCNNTVGTGDDCDCDNPCPAAQGCFPGICGASPQKCFNGCFPGSTSGAGQKPDACPDVNGQPYFCIALPANQVTVQNKGGSCVPGDNCSVTTQNCPMMLLDRSQPAGANNPLVAYDCLPVYPGVNGCFPAGTKTQGVANCDQQCGTVAAGVAAVQDNCAVGFGCVQPVGPNGPLGPATCEAQCDNPSFTASTHVCASNPKEICEGVYEPYGNQMVDFTSGTCCINSLGPCTQATASECCAGTCGQILPGACD